MADAKPAKERAVKCEKVLESGRKVRVFKGTAYDMVKAQMMVASPMEAQLALAALLVEVDGAMMPFEDWKDFDLTDYMELLPFLLGSSPATPEG